MPKRFVVYQDNQSGLLRALNLDKEKETFDRIEDIASVPIFKTIDAKNATKAKQVLAHDADFLNSLETMLIKKQELQLERKNWVTPERLAEDEMHIATCRQKIHKYRRHLAA